MLIKDNYYLGLLGSTYFIWNEKKIIYLEAKNLQNAIKESKKYI